MKSPDGQFREALDYMAEVLATARGLDVDGRLQLSVSDVLALLDEWTAALAAAHVAVTDRWLPTWSRLVEEVLAIAAAQRATLDARYPDPHRVIDLLAQLAAELDADRVRARLAEGLRAGWRNATLTVAGDALDIDGVTDWVDLWGALWRHLRDTRGLVAITSPRPNPHAPTSCPNTTVAEVRWLVDFWTQRLEDLGDRRIAGTDAAIAAWRAAAAHVAEVARGRSDTEPYPENGAFWLALEDYVTALDLARENAVPATWRLYLQAAGYAVHQVGSVVTNAGAAVWHDTTSVIGTVAHGVEDAAASVASGLARPLLIGGAVVVGGALLFSFARK